MSSNAPPLRTRLMVLAISSGITALFAEGLVRLVDGNALPMIHLFEEVAGQIRLQTDGQARITSPRGEAWTLSTDERGYRLGPVPPAADAWLVVGDSQVMGNGVNDADPFPARVLLDGGSAHNAGVPGYGVEDAAALAEAHLTVQPARGIVIIVNQMNDWDEAGAPVGQRYVVKGGWLLDTEDALGPRGRFLANPLSSSHLIFLLGHLLLKDWEAPGPEAPKWLTDPDSQVATTATIARAIHALAARHPLVPVVPVYLPADAFAAEERLNKSPLSPFLEGQTPWADSQIRDQAMHALGALDPLDLTPTLKGRPDAFLDGDYHLSALGHGLVAMAISDHVSTRDARITAPPVSPDTVGAEPKVP